MCKPCLSQQVAKMSLVRTRRILEDADAYLLLQYLCRFDCESLTFHFEVPYQSRHEDTDNNSEIVSYPSYTLADYEESENENKGHGLISCNSISTRSTPFIYSKVRFS